MALDINRKDAQQLFYSTYADSPIPTSIYDRDGFQVACNKAHVALWNLPEEDTVGRFNMVTDPQLAASGSAENHRRVMQGETIVLPPHSFDSYEAGLQSEKTGRRWVEGTYFPLRDASGAVSHLCAILRDISREMEQQQAIAVAQEQIDSQLMTIESLSSPVIQVWQGILTMPLVGTIDTKRSMAITANLLDTIARQQAQCVIIDITGVPIVDTQVAQHIIQASQACRLLGCNVVLVGIGVEIAQTLVQLGVDLRSLVTLANLQAGIAWAFERLNLRVVQNARA
ncbi:MAG TPA: STAS domain-containing protein [Roseiflexaceae bacterium]|nr:STAS domain-containing protein [Roseiflexaceae bacterium]